MNFASLELSKELYELSGWDDDFNFSPNWHVDSDQFRIAPKYDLGYLLRKLAAVELYEFANGKWKAVWSGSDRKHSGRSNSSPENAVARLIIQLFEERILNKAVV
jgi:hypothetical protein